MRPNPSNVGRHNIEQGINWGLFDKVLEAIETKPEQWNQRFWHLPTFECPLEDVKFGDCGTAHCFAGWAQIIADPTIASFRYPAILDTWSDARIALNMTFDESNWLFEPDRTLEDFKAFRAAGKELEQQS